MKGHMKELENLLTVGQHEVLFTQTESIIKAVNQEFLERYSEKREYVVLDDSVMSDLLWVAVDNFRMMKLIDKAVRENKTAKA
jgi:hypothetical protein